MNAEEPLSPDQAMSEVGRVNRRVRDSARGPGWMFVIMGIATIVYWPAMFLGHGPVPSIAGAGWIVMTIAVCVYWYRLEVFERRLMRINNQATAVYVITSLVTFLVGAFLLPDEPTAGWAAFIILLSAVTGLTLLHAAWRLLEQ
jgi:hypothetical protein